MTDSVILVAGSNVTDRIDFLVRGRGGLGRFGDIVAFSDLYLTSPFGPVEQMDFLNCAMILDTELPPDGLLNAIKSLEADIGRSRRERWGPREIDIDIALWGNIVLKQKALTIPHIGLAERDFFLIPILQIAPDARYPGTEKPLSEILRDIPETKRTVKAIVEDERWRSTTT